MRSHYRLRNPTSLRHTKSNNLHGDETRQARENEMDDLHVSLGNSVTATGLVEPSKRENVENRMKTLQC